MEKRKEVVMESIIINQSKKIEGVVVTVKNTIVIQEPLSKQRTFYLFCVDFFIKVIIFLLVYYVVEKCWADISLWLWCWGISTHINRLRVAFSRYIETAKFFK